MKLKKSTILGIIAGVAAVGGAMVDVLANRVSRLEWMEEQEAKAIPITAEVVPEEKPEEETSEEA